MIVWLIGMPGSGKSTVGAALAARLGCGFVDADAEVERRAARGVAQIFEDEGEPGFRAREAAVIEDLARAEAAVIATGGGAPVDGQLRDLMRASGTVVHLDAPPEVLAERVGAATGRPLLGEPGALERLATGRAGAYAEAAHRIVDATGTREEVLDRILEALP